MSKKGENEEERKKEPEEGKLGEGYTSDLESLFKGGEQDLANRENSQQNETGYVSDDEDPSRPFGNTRSVSPLSTPPSYTGFAYQGEDQNFSVPPASFESLMPNTKKVEEVVQEVVDKEVDQAIDQLGADPKVIKEIITVRRDANIEVLQFALEFSGERDEQLNDINDTFIKANKTGNYSKEQAVIQQIRAEHLKMRGFIDATKPNVSDHVSLKLDNTLDQNKAKNKLILNVHDAPRLITIKGSEGKPMQVWVPTLQQLQDELKRTKQTTKIWQGLSKIQGDDDRSKGYAALSDNIASMAMTGINTGRQGIALVQALLTYAVADVLYHGLLEGAGKGLVKGAVTGYKRTNKGIKSAANAMYVMMDRSEKNLEKAVNQMKATYLDDLVDDQDQSVQEISRKILDSIESKLETASFDAQSKLKADKALLEAAINKAPKYAIIEGLSKKPNPNLATKGVAIAAGVVGAVVVGITNAIWEGVKNPALALTKNASAKLGQRYIKPAQGTSWNKDRATVKEELKTKRKAKSQIRYAKKTDKEGKFAKMVKDRKEAAQKAKSI